MSWKSIFNDPMFPVVKYQSREQTRQTIKELTRNDPKRQKTGRSSAQSFGLGKDKYKIFLIMMCGGVGKSTFSGRWWGRAVLHLCLQLVSTLDQSNWHDAPLPWFFAWIQPASLTATTENRSNIYKWLEVNLISTWQITLSYSIPTIKMTSVNCYHLQVPNSLRKVISQLGKKINSPNQHVNP